ncbi:WD domain, G-beta repeat-containing protein [Hyaloraphidium curvatum]|nr:WD domain, G-beta repeat-containing protein [Hyaloraphidium curvatum]
MISALAFLPRGAAAEKPSVYRPSAEDLEKLRELAGEEVEAARSDLERAMGEPGDGMEDDSDAESGSDSGDNKKKISRKAVPPGKANPEDLSEYHLEDYDDGEGPADPASRLFSNVSALAVPGPDPYLDTEAADSDDDELVVLASDGVIIAARTEDEVSTVEVLVYEREEGNAYVRNDWMVTGMPLCLEWMDFGPGAEKGSYIAVGSFESTIDVWSLDVVDAMLPTFVIGTALPKKTGKKKSKLVQKSDVQHTGAVVSLAWNRNARHLLASGSADTTVKLWDLNSPSAAVASYAHHTAPVQALQWHPTDAPLLVSASHDKTARVIDSRAPASGLSFDLPADAEAARWLPSGDRFLVACEDGAVLCFDPRSSQRVWTLQAHEGACSGLDASPTFPGLVVTGGADRTCKVWDMREKPRMLASREFQAGRIFSAQLAPDAACVAVGGTGGKVVLWDLGEVDSVRRAWEGVEGEGENRREVVVVEEGGSGDEADSDDEEGENAGSDGEMEED